MKQIWVGFVLIVMVGLLSSCKSQFETVRQSGDKDLMLEKGYMYYDNGDYIKAKTLFDIILNEVRGTADAEKLFYTYAEMHYKMGQFLLAAYYFENFASTYANSVRREDADYYSALSNYKLSPSYRLDQENTEKAITEFQRFVNRYPTSPRVKEASEIIEELRTKLEVKAYEAALLYYNLRMYQAAHHALENVIRDYPDIDNSEEIKYLSIKASFDLAVNSVYERQRERYEKTMKKISEFMRRYPNSKHLKELKHINKKSTEKLKSLKYV